ncbi:MAG TPA: DNA mismatch repair endonuclease MutL [Nitrospira sp.]|nr:DNA mismatch repair endonuclease MutL [Nitrospira sp.]
MPAADCLAQIHILPADVVTRIAAGEVIERPAAVVKELVENSLDAGARQITIDVKDGGLSLIRVIDDGAGIRRNDLALAFERHATSKLRTDLDLRSVTTMGFRGEALPSIASVSHVEITTSTRQDQVGARMVLIGGRQECFTEVAPLRGTKIEVSELFFNQPARKKFLKSSATEFMHISRTVEQAALAWPSVHFRLTHNGQDMFNYPEVASARERILQVHQAAFLDRTVDVRGRMAGCAISGVAVDPVQARASRTPQELFINRRPVRSPTVFHAVSEAYGSRLAKGCFPTYVLFLDVDPARIDVNVHPAKREVRFSEPDSIHQLVRHALRHALSGPERSEVFEGPGRDAVADLQPSTRNTAVRTPGSEQPVLGHADSIGLPQLSAFARETTPPYGGSSRPEVLPLGQILSRYLVAQVGSELHVLDQHTAHERVVFERLRRRWKSKTITSQPLLIPNPVELSAAQCALLDQHADELESLGLVLELFGPTTIAVRALPVELLQSDAAALLRDLLDDIAERDRTSSLEQRVNPILASLACHSAVRAGRTLALPEIKQVIDDWIEAGLATTCPHGRRTTFRLSTDELDKLFGRVGWS